MGGGPVALQDLLQVLVANALLEHLLKSRVEVSKGVGLWLTHPRGPLHFWNSVDLCL